MKKFLSMAAVVAVAFTMASCLGTTHETSRTEVMPYAMYNASVADLEVSGERVVYTLNVPNKVFRLGAANAKRAAVQECLSKVGGNADLLIEPMFVVTMKKTFWHPFGRPATVTVSGRPAKYKNFRSMPDNVWTDPVFRGTKNVEVKYFNGKPMDGCCDKK